MARNQEVIRQWQILRTLDARRAGVHIDDLARDLCVTTRTIRRDLDAIVTAGFPIYDERRDGRTYWKLDERLFQRLGDLGLSLSELSALYFGRTLIESLVGDPFRQDVRTAFQKIEKVLPSKLRAELDRLRGVFTLAGNGRGTPVGPGDPRHVKVIVDAILAHRRLRLRYYSMSSRREKMYLIEPVRVVLGQGALYLRAFVPEYGGMRTFAINRVAGVSPLEETFEPRTEAETDPFGHSLGVHSGPPVDVVLEFNSTVAPYVAERIWHPSQTLTPLPDGRLRVSLRVTDDVALRTWVLGYGGNVRVVAPTSLAQWVREELEEMRTVYTATPRPDGQPPLPFESAVLSLVAHPQLRATLQAEQTSAALATLWRRAPRPRRRR